MPFNVRFLSWSSEFPGPLFVDQAGIDSNGHPHSTVSHTLGL